MGKFRRFTQLDVVYSSGLVKLFYFLYYGGCACLFPFFTLYLRHLGLSAPQVGIIFGGKYLLWYFFGPLWIALAVRVQKTKIVLGLSVLLAIVSNLSITLIPSSNDFSLVGNCHYKTPNQSLDNSVPTSVGNGQVFKFNSSYNLTTHDQPIGTTSAYLSGSTVAEPHTTNSYNEVVSLQSMPATFSTTLSPYQMAMYLNPRVVLSDPKSISDIQRLVSSYDETRYWPIWKQKIVARQLLKFLHDRLLSSVGKEKSGIETSTDASPTSKSITDNSTELDKVLAKVIRDLVSAYLYQHQRDPDVFFNSLANIRELPIEVQAKLRMLFKKALKEMPEYVSRQKREIFISDNTSDGVLPDETKGGLQLYMRSLVAPITDNLDLFIMVLVIVLAGEVIAAPVDLLSDNSFHDYLDKMDCLHLYGSHKISAQIATLLAGLSVSAAMYFLPCVGFNSMPRDHVIFYAFAIMAGLSLVVVPFYPASEQRSNCKASDLGVSVCPSCTTRVFSNSRRIMHLATVLIGGMIQATEYNFLLWHVEKLPGSCYPIYGFLVAANALATLLAFALGRCFKKFNWIIPLSLLSIAAKLFIYSYLKQAWYFIPVQGLNMFGLPLLWTVIYYETNLMTSPNDEPDLLKGRGQIRIFAQTSQKRAIYNAYVCAFQGIGFSLGSLVAGCGFYLAGESLIPTLRIAACVASAWAVMCFVCQLCCAKAKTQNRKDYLTLLDESGDEDELYDKNAFPVKRGRKPLSGYRDAKKLAQSRKKKRSTKKEVFLSCDDELERDWQALNSKKEAKIL